MEDPGEYFAVFRVDDRLHGRTDHLQVIFVQNTLSKQVNPAIQRSLSTESEQDSVGFFLLYYFFNKISGNRQKVNLIRNLFGSLDGGDVGIDQDGVNSLLLQCLQCLGTGIVKFTGLTDFESP